MLFGVSGLLLLLLLGELADCFRVFVSVLCPLVLCRCAVIFFCSVPLDGTSSHLARLFAEKLNESAFSGVSTKRQFHLS